MTIAYLSRDGGHADKTKPAQQARAAALASVAPPLCLSLLCLWPGAATALALGELKLESALNQPLQARIDLLEASAAEIDSLRVNLVDPGTFAAKDPVAAGDKDAEKAEGDPPAVSRGFKLELMRRRAAAYIQVSTSEPVNEPFQRFLLEAVWGGGRLLRQYTVLLAPPSRGRRVPPPPVPPAPPPRRPPSRAAPPTAAVPAPPRLPLPRRPPSRAESVTASPGPVTPPPVAEKPLTPAATAPAASAPAAASVSAPAATAPAATTTKEPRRYGPTTATDTLWSIASRTRPASVSVQQMMLALLRANPQAFHDGNINGLRRGQTLTVPTLQEISDNPATAAASEVKSQHDDWDDGAPRPGPRPKSGPELRLLTPGGAADAVAPPALPPDLPADTPANLAIATERIASLSAENADLKVRQAEAQAASDELSRQLAVKESELAALQNKLRRAERDDSPMTYARAAWEKARALWRRAREEARRARDAAPRLLEEGKRRLAEWEWWERSKEQGLALARRDPILAGAVTGGAALLLLYFFWILLLRRPRRRDKDAPLHDHVPDLFAPADAPVSRSGGRDLFGGGGGPRRVAAQPPRAREPAPPPPVPIPAPASAPPPHTHAPTAPRDNSVFMPRPAAPPRHEEEEEEAVEAGISTKLDLAKAYVELGDEVGAKSLLYDILEEGNAEQKRQARELLDQT